jgi:hypothetical protein
MQPILPHSTRNLMTSKKNQQSEPTKPKILLIGTSNIKGIDEERLSAKFVLMVNELTLWRASVRQIAVVTNKYIPYIVKFVFYKGICQFHFDVKVVKSRGSQR